MLVLECHKPTFFDVDETLVFMTPPPKDDPNTYESFIIESPEFNKQVWVNHFNVEAMYEHKARNHTIFVWSAGGWKWAETVVHRLGLEHIVDYVIEKPSWVYDDIPANMFIGTPIWKGNKAWKSRELE